MKCLKKIGRVTLIVMGLSLLTACAKPTVESVPQIDPVCEVLQRPLEDHMNSIIDYGRQLLEVEADEVIVTATEVSDVFRVACRKVQK